MQNKNPKSLFGIDINEYSQNVNFKTLTTKIDFLYLRSSGSGTGRFRVDKKFLEFAKSSRDYGIPVGAYHYGVPGYNLQTADSQCDDFINILQEGFGNRDYGDLFPVLDIETPTENKLPTATLINWIDRFRKRFERRTRRRLMLYTGIHFIEMYNNFKMPNGSFPLKNMPLWIAMYVNIPGNPPYPIDQGGWTRWRMWQYSETQKIAGVDNPVDANWGPNNIELLIQPDAIKGLKVVDIGNSIRISWNRVDDIDLLGYNLFANNYWIGTVNEDATQFTINKNKLPIGFNQSITISIEAFDHDGETSKTRTKANLR